MRVDGSDFFAGITFPVDKSFCSLILGGWGGQRRSGSSSINDLDASENSTSQSMVFEKQRWYTVRIRVTPEKIDSWLDDEHDRQPGAEGQPHRRAHGSRSLAAARHRLVADEGRDPRHPPAAVVSRWSAGPLVRRFGEAFEPSRVKGRRVS